MIPKELHEIMYAVYQTGPPAASPAGREDDLWLKAPSVALVRDRTRVMMETLRWALEQFPTTAVRTDSQLEEIFTLVNAFHALDAEASHENEK